MTTPCHTQAAMELIKSHRATWGMTGGAEGFCDVLSDMPQDMADQLVKGGHPAAVVQFMARRLDAPGLQWRGCMALAKMGRSQAGAQSVLDAGGVRAVANALLRHAEDRTVAACALWAAFLLGQTAPEAEDLAVGAVRALQAHAGDEDMALQALGTLDRLNSPAARRAAAQAGGSAALCAALAAHPGCEDLQAAGCWLLGALTSGGLLEEGEAPAVGAALLKAFATPSERVCAAACQALAAAANPARGPAWGRAASGSGPALLGAMRLHPQCEQVQLFGTIALCRLHAAKVSLPPETCAVVKLASRNCPGILRP